MFRKINRRQPRLSDVQRGIHKANTFQKSIAKEQRKQDDERSVVQKVVDFFKRLFGRKVSGPRIFKYHWEAPTTTPREKDRAKVKRRKMAYRSRKINRRNGSAKR